MEAIVRRYLGLLVRIKLRRCKARIIGVTGSMGKTSTKNAIVQILEKRYRVQSSTSGYNTAIGLPLMILGLESPGKSLVGWMRVCVLAIVRTFRSEDWEYIVVEMGVDKKGDMNELLAVMHPDVAVVTAIARVHTAAGQFQTEEEIAEEKLHITSKLTKAGTFVYNYDNDWLRGLVPQLNLEAKTLTYGTGIDTDVQATNIVSSLQGLEFDVSYLGQQAHAISSVLGRVQTYTLLAAIAVGLNEGMTLADTLEAIQGYRLPNGRMNLLPGIHGSMLIDSSYNASLKAVEEALKTLKEIKAERRIAVLGQMNELGDYSKEAHQHIGRFAADCCDMLFCVFGDARLMREAAIEAGMPPARVLYFADSEDVGQYLKNCLQEGDIALFKGSQNNVRLEKAIKQVMAHPEDAQKLLVRQTGIWSKK